MESQKTLITLCMHCLNSIVIEFQSKYFQQDTGIVTGDNNSVALANIALHFVVKEITAIKEFTTLYQRYIDDILYITEEKEHSVIVKSKLTEGFNKYGLDLTFREIYTGNFNLEIEFLYVLHVTDHNAKNGFITKDFTKPTAIDQTFLNGTSYHPRNVFTATIKVEATRRRRLNENNTDFVDSMTRLENKCLKSGFNKSLTSNAIIKMAKKYENDVPKEEIKDKEKDKKIITWAAQFKDLIKLDKKEKELAPKSIISFSKPCTLASHLLNYKKISVTRNGKNNTHRGSKKCKRCGLCGHHGKLQNMVCKDETIKLRNGKVIAIKHTLTCKDFGIYGARCLKCADFYVGQTKNSYAKRWTTHRHHWNNMIKNREAITSAFKEKRTNKMELKDDQALFAHYAQNHPECLKSYLFLHNAYEVFFLWKPKAENLDIEEKNWICKLNAGINIMRTLLPKYK